MVSDSCPDYMLRLELLISMPSCVNLERPYSLKQTEEVVPDQNLWRMRYHPKVFFWCHMDLKMVVLLWAHTYEEAVSDHQLLVMCKWISFSLSLQGANTPARAELLLGEEEKQMFHEVYDSVLYLDTTERMKSLAEAINLLAKDKRKLSRNCQFHQV
ncbi:hypothetical protein L1987_14864 [Smallanthus sonchifolius]|uniref:Uncharacterized protein n=1 Tax=Smallanthus sonchifolius TaxID=185202 RepID=A0ACB9J4I1_9ASTR|nr:hypothetical protein L1987_14864 [Smallanthus sonchifolius]